MQGIKLIRDTDGGQSGCGEEATQFLPERDERVRHPWMFASVSVRIWNVVDVARCFHMVKKKDERCRDREKGCGTTNHVGIEVPVHLTVSDPGGTRHWPLCRRENAKL